MTDSAPKHEPETKAEVAEEIRLDVAHEISDEYLARGRSPLSPEAREEQVEKTVERLKREGIFRRSYARVAPGTRSFEVIKRVAVGTYTDGFIHAGNLAYLSLIALFPFFITATAILGTLGDPDDRIKAIAAILSTMPPGVADTLREPLDEVVTNGRTGWLLWLSAAVGLWTVGSLIETMRDILRRAYGTTFSASFWQYRLYSIGLIVSAVILLLLSFSAQVLLTGAEEFIERVLPDQFDAFSQIAFSRGVSAVGLFAALYMLFYTLTPSKYRKACPKWPGALFVTMWWVCVTLALPPLLSGILSYDATYGSMAGVMVALFFFYLVGLGVVVGAELNAALVEAGSPNAAYDSIGQGDDRSRKG